METRKIDLLVTIAMASLFLVLSIYAWVKPVDLVSDTERRKLATFPKLTWEHVLSGKFMTEFETYTSEQFPLREHFRSLKANVSMRVLGQRDNNDIYMQEGYLSRMEYPMNEESIDRAAERFRNIYDRFLVDKDVEVYISIIPDKNYFLAQPNGYLSMDYDAFFEQMLEKTDYMQHIDIKNQLEIQDYYKTDTHWRQECLVDVAKFMAEQMGTMIRGEYEVHTLDVPFYGVYYGQSALRLEPEQIQYLSNDTMEKYVVFDYENNRNISVYDMEKAYGNDPYEMFLSGSLSLLTIENPQADTDKELIIFRDSFGSSIAPLLAEGYAKTTLVDIRYIQPEMLERYIEFDKQDVLFLYSTLVLNNSETIK